MPTLAQQLDAMRLKALAQHEDAVQLLNELDARMTANDIGVMRQLEAILDGDWRRKQDITAALRQVAARIGCVPSLPAPGDSASRSRPLGALESRPLDAVYGASGRLPERESDAPSESDWHHAIAVAAREADHGYMPGAGVH